MTLKDLKIRDAKIMDFDSVFYIENKSFDNPWTKEQLLDELEGPRRTSLIASIDKVLVGYLLCWQILDEMQLLKIAVLPSYRNKGVAKNMMLLLETIALEKKIKTITLELRQSNKQACSLYTDLGFQIVGQRKGYYSDTKENALLMTLELKNE